MPIIYTYPVKATPSGDDLILISDSTNNATKQAKVSSLPFTNNDGTVSSVGLSMPAAFDVSNSPITGNGVLTVTVTGGQEGQFLDYTGNWSTPPTAGAAGQNSNVQYNDTGALAGDSSFNFIKINNGTEGQDPNSFPKAHEVLLGAGGGGLPGMLTLFGDDDPKSTQGTSGILKYNLSTGIDYVTLTGPDIQTELSIATPGTNYVVTPNSQPTGAPVTGGNGSGLRIFIVAVSETGAIEQFSIAQQGGGYQSGDTVTLPNLGDGNASFTVINAREGGNEILQYDIKLPKYKPFDDKIWFGKGTGKYGELTTNDYFKIPLITEPDHSPGGRLQLTIGSSALTPNEPYGSILLNGGNNNDEGGLIRLASATNNIVGIAGPQPSPSPVADYRYDFSLPVKSPEQTEQSFNQGAQTVVVDTAGSGYSQGAIAGTLNPQGTGLGCTVRIDSVGASGEVTAVSVHQPGEGYSVGNKLTLVIGSNQTAIVEVMAIDGYKNKVLVASEDKAFGPSGEKLYETRWVDPNDLGISGTGGGTPGGAATNVQFQNASGDFDGNSEFTYNGSGIATLGDTGSSNGILLLSGRSQIDSGLLKIGHANSTKVLTIGLGNGTMSANYAIDFPVAAPGANNKILESDSAGVLSWIDTPTESIIVEDEGTVIANTATTINFTGGGVFAEVPDPLQPNKVNVEVAPRRNDGFSPYPIYQGDSAITIAGSTNTVRAFGCNAICDVQGGQMTVARIYGELQELLKFSMAVYKGELSDASNTKLVAFGTQQIGATAAGKRIHRLNLDTTNVWVPEAGTPIVVVFEFVNSVNQLNNSLILGSGTSGDADDLFGTDLAFEISGTTQVFNDTNRQANSSVTDLVNYETTAEKTQLRVCHHFDPFAPTQTVSGAVTE